MVEVLEGQRGQAVQLPMPEKLREGQRCFKKGEIIWPASSRRGVLRENITAHRIPGRVRGLSGWESEETLPLYFDRRTWQLPPKTKFGAYSKRPKR